jgi:hypothetical protein
MNSRVCRWLILLALVPCASGAWAQCSSPVFGQENIAALKQKAASGNAAAQCGVGRMYEFGWGVPQVFTQSCHLAQEGRRARTCPCANGSCPLTRAALIR